MVEHHGSQCGFCTPGFVMALYTHYKSARDGVDAGGAAHRATAANERQALCDALAGNLCRCTGYAPILTAGADMRRHADAKREAAEDAARAQRLRELPADTVKIEREGVRFCAPRSAAELARWLAKNPGARLLAGGTDLGLEITKRLRHFDCVAYVGRVAELRVLREDAAQLEIGAAVTYAEAHAALARLHPDLGELVRRIGGAQVRAAGTLGGNVANGSPIGDTMPALLALDAQVLVDRQGQKCKVPLYSFYTGYRRSVLRAGEFIRSLQIPKLGAGARFAAYKLSRRFDQDISGVCAAFCAETDGTVRFGFGGMAAIPARAPKAEAAWADGVEAACAALAGDFRPLSDHRASDWYRLSAAQNLLRKFAAGVSPRAVLEVAP
jgi:xanthine dehydrogenase small subunit